MPRLHNSYLSVFFDSPISPSTQECSMASHTSVKATTIQLLYITLVPGTRSVVSQEASTKSHSH